VDVTLVADALGTQLSGIGRYVLELCRRVPTQPDVDRVRYLAHGRFFEEVEPLIQGKLPRRRPGTPNWLRIRLDRRRLRNSVVHGPNYFLPPAADCGIITVHDLSVFRFPEMHPAERIREFERDFESSLGRAAHVITDSETIRRELIADFGVPEASVTAVHLGVAAGFRPRTAAELEPALASLDLRAGQYALCVSALEPRKKIAELIRAWSGLPASIRNSTPLVLAGAEGWLNDQLHAEIRDGVSAGWLKHLGYIPDSDLIALYAGAALFIYPSTYEGFGLPPLEAMASGVPVLVANRSCLPEVCGDAAGYIDPDDVGAFTEAIVKGLSDSEWRGEARERGLERAADFTWDRCIAATVNIYGSVFR
jgi:glycosyltransferase involved in cell wall biosynthesis